MDVRPAGNAIDCETQGADHLSDIDYNQIKSQASGKHNLRKKENKTKKRGIQQVCHSVPLG